MHRLGLNLKEHKYPDFWYTLSPMKDFEKRIEEGFCSITPQGEHCLNGNISTDQQLIIGDRGKCEPCEAFDLDFKIPHYFPEKYPVQVGIKQVWNGLYDRFNKKMLEPERIIEYRLLCNNHPNYSWLQAFYFTRIPAPAPMSPLGWRYNKPMEGEV